MAALNRKPDKSALKEFTLPDGATKIGIKRLTVRELMDVSNNKSYTQEERGMRILAAKMLVNGESIRYDDLLDCFTDDEITFIASQIDTGEAEKNV